LNPVDVFLGENERFTEQDVIAFDLHLTEFSGVV
jgi:hypothetical protein